MERELPKPYDRDIQSLREPIMRWLQERFNRSYVSIEFFGSDHWGTFAYVETCCVEAHGVLDNLRMRCDARLHRAYVHMETGVRILQAGRVSPTKLKCDIPLDNHDDWSCLEDLQEAGLLNIIDERVKKIPYAPGFRRVDYREDYGMFPNLTCQVELTPLGRQVASAYREHRSAGHNSASFEMPRQLIEGRKEAAEVAA